MFHLGWFAFEGIQGWASAEYDASYPWSTPSLHQEMARELERAAFDFILIEDLSAVPDDYAGTSEVYLRSCVGTPKFDPAVLATYMAAATSRLGIIPTLTTTFYPPYLLARLTASLDHLSSGRLGWNIVTSSSDLAARNFGLDGLPEHDARYDMADEYMELCERLWRSWEPDAVLADRSSGTFADYRKVHRIDFKGKWYTSRGPLNVPRPPQGRPVLAQAGNSERGKRFAAQHADVVLTPVIYPPAVRAFRTEIRRLAVQAQRSPDDLRVMALAFPKVFDSVEEVETYRKSLARVSDRVIQNWLAQVSAITTLDLSRYDLDEPLPGHVQTNGSRGTLDWLRSGGATLREMALRMARLTPDEPLVGTVEQVAEEMGAIMDSTGGDGFLIGGALTPKYVHTIARKLVPALQRRGLVRTEYSHETFRGNLFAF